MTGLQKAFDQAALGIVYGLVIGVGAFAWSLVKKFFGK